MSGKGNGKGFIVADTTVVALGPSHVDDLTDAVVALTRMIRRLDETLQAHGSHIRDNTISMHNLLDHLGPKPLPKEETDP